ncbi:MULTISPECIES: DUF6531 domain-containing protein [unclassified Streptomyces]|uniref:DUF6531 domain-containing protein n=1 Tax=unclassified Streptomyces TaxID=2593676 RepID=UPI001EFA3275|nr:DUF6531 domain-containing protein [Streptomyces sp. SceaMP-e96]
MGVVLPGWADEVLDIIGVSWPNVDEDDYRDMADAMREFADDIDHGANEAHTAIQGLVGSAGGSLAVEALNAHWGKINGTHLKNLGECGRMAATAMDGVAVLIEGAKIGAIVQLGILAAEVIAAQAAAPFTLGLSEVGALAATQATRVIVKRLFKEVCQQVAEQVISIALTPVEEALGAMVGDLVVQIGANALGAKDGVDLGQTAKAGKDGFQQGVQDAKDSAKSAAANPMELLSAGGGSGGGGGGGAGGGFSFDPDEHDRVVTGLQSAGGTFRNKAGGKIGRARSHHGRTRGKDAIANAANAMLDKVIDGIEDGVKKTAKHLDDNMTRGVKQMAKNHQDNDRKLADHFTGIGKGDKKDPKAPGGGIGGVGNRAGGKKQGSGSPKSPLRNGAAEPEKTSTPADDRNCRSDPIDIASGEMVLAQEDVSLPAVLPLLLSRTHVSSYRCGGWFGPSWSSTLDQRLELDDEGAVFATEDGMILVYPVPRHDEPVLPLEGPRWPLSWDTETPGGLRISDPQEGRSWHFARLANVRGELREGSASPLPLTAITDRHGNQIDIDYSDDGTPSEVWHSGGYRIGVETAGLRITGLRLLDARSSDAVALTATEPTGNAGVEGASATGLLLTAFAYDANGNLAEVTNSSGVPMGFTYDQDGRITSWTDRNQHRYDYLYDAAGRCVETRGEGGFLNAVFVYDDEARCTRVTDALGQVTVYELNERGQTTKETDPSGAVTSFEWDRYHRLLRRTDPLGLTVTMEYDAAGDATAVTRPDGSRMTAVYNDLHQPLLMVGADGSGWQYAYDDCGNLLQITDPAGATTNYEYGSFGHLTAVTDAIGQTTRLTANAAGLPVSVTDPLGAVTTCERDAFGRPRLVTDPMGAVTAFGWTVEGQPAWCTRPDGHTERWSYDAEENLRQHVDAAGGTTSFEYTFFDRVSARTGPDGARFTFAYDAELRLIAVTNPHGQQWRYTHDSLGRVVQETDFNGRHISYTHDVAGRLTSRTNGAGQTVRYTRDLLDRVVREATQAGGARFHYDAEGRLLYAANGATDLAFTYDPAGRLLTEQRDSSVIEFGYDGLGRRTLRRTPSGVESRWTYDAAGRPATLVSAGREVRFGHDLAGREIRRNLGAAVLSQTWDPANRMTAQTLSGMSAPPGADIPETALRHRTFAYRPDDQLLGFTDTMLGTRAFDLDPVGRVTSVSGHNWSETYAYDTAGNLAYTGGQTAGQASLNDTSGTRSYNGTLLRQAGRTSYEYDGQGRVIKQSRRLLSGGTRTWHYSWDADDRLTTVTLPDGTVWCYHYDPLGRRIAKERLSGDTTTVVEQTTFTWDGTVLAEELRSGSGSAGVQVTSWEWDPVGYRVLTQVDRAAGGSEPTQEEFDERFYSIITDLVGTPTELVDEDGAIAWHSRSTLWGTPLPVDPRETVVGCSLGFPGQYHDRESGLHYNLFRYYDSLTGRYLSPDPLGLGPAPDPHGYVDNPFAEIDPLGLAKKKCPVIIERYGSEAEAKASAAVKPNGGLVPRPGHERQPKWIAQTGKVNPGTLGKSKNYTHKMEFHCKPEVLAWLKQYEIKPTNEPGRYAVPADKIDEFNKYVEKTTVQPLDSGGGRRRRR